MKLNELKAEEQRSFERSQLSSVMLHELPRPLVINQTLKAVVSGGDDVEKMI